MIRILQNVLSIGRKVHMRLTRAGIPAAATALLALLLSPAGLACMSCDSNDRCHSGDEQGGYLCRVSEVRCGILSQIFGAECHSRTCETFSPCDNRRPKAGVPESDVIMLGAPCPGTAETETDLSASVVESE